MNILLITPLAEQRGGSERLFANLLNYGRDIGVHWTVVFLCDGPMVQEMCDLGVDVHVIDAGKVRDLARVAATVRKIAALVRQKNVDVVLSWMTKGQLYGGPAAALAKTPGIWYLHEIPRGVGIDHLATWLPARGVICTSQKSAQAQRRLRPLRETRVVDAGIVLEAFDPAALPGAGELRNRLGLCPNGPLIVMVGRLQHWKGMHTLVRALPGLRQRYPDCEVAIVGGAHDLEPKYEAYLRRQVADRGLTHMVRIMGYQSNVAEWMQAADVVVHASRNEPFGLVILEAMALGKPVVAGDRGGASEIITPGVNGLLTPFEDVGALTDAILRYLDDPAFAAAAGAAARVRVQKFDAHGYPSRVVGATRELLNLYRTRAAKQA